MVNSIIRHISKTSSRRWRVVSIVLLLLGLAIPSLSAKTMKDLFRSMPDSLCFITESGRLDCMDFLSSGMKGTVSNLLGESFVLNRITDNYVSLQPSHSSRIELKLLVEGSDSILCLVHTWYTPTPESEMEFYDTQWHKVSDGASRCDKTSVKDFVIPSAKGESPKAVMDKMGTSYIQMQLSDQEQTLTLTLNCWDGDKDLQKELSPHLLPKLCFVWKEGKFKRTTL